MALKNARGIVTTVAGTAIYTAPSGKTAQVIYMSICNTGAVDGIATVQWLDSSNSNAITRWTWEVPIEAGETLELSGLVLEAGDTLHVRGNATATLNVSAALDEQ